MLKISKVKLYRLFKNEDYQEISLLFLYMQEDLPNNIKPKYIEELKNYALKIKDVSLCFKLLDYVSLDSKKEIIRFVVLKHPYEIDYSINRDYIKKYYNLFLKEIIVNNNFNDLKAMKTMASIVIFYGDDKAIEKIIKYCEDKPIFVANLMTLPKFKILINRYFDIKDEYKEMKLFLLLDKIKDISVLDNIWNYIKSMDDYNEKVTFAGHFLYKFPEYLNEFLIKENDDFKMNVIKFYFTKYEDKFTNFIHFDNLYELMYEYVKTIKDDDLKGKYLVELLKNKNNFKKNEIIDRLLLIGNLSYIEDIIIYFSESEQEMLAKKALEENNILKIKSLAVTTDSVMTYKLIDYLCSLNDYEINIYLANNLKGRFLSYALDYIVKNNDNNYVLAILNNINVVAVMAFVTFIIDYKYLTKFDEHTQDNIRRYFMGEDEFIRKLKK